MLDKINNDFNINKILLNLHAYRQEILASNIANANTPGHKSSDINFSKTFGKLFSNALQGKKNNLTTTSNKHISNNDNVELSNYDEQTVKNNSYVSKNNAINIDVDRINFVHNGLKYNADVVFINNKFKNIMNVLKG
ncbi:flagellar basal-body rod protein Flgb [Buchnera aphidicola str. Bp (Baizongia pistaciae)]|uniref:Flagellar basal body rod protein FlgB n=1 Tax=Buchnera aphidicola subsp. Baizongia pistaciae (strain Bp) TaxID=224915 RepID=FLGB_BUCBP|nr:flagellar basal body rod protein FlgB [Buchnera aphidicola]Q89AI0.1 RecName: Full=Flagellar basal body rod protein FlgB [Buchnera aphidicola str. Bp (Baizongia pistaciae)]AAO27032.1 flagellar basal-body rod protein Flgb [Buchnera aphidicola str. Bp (Baizongia pistaciae)]